VFKKITVGQRLKLEKIRMSVDILCATRLFEIGDCNIITFTHPNKLLQLLPKNDLLLTALQP